MSKEAANEKDLRAAAKAAASRYRSTWLELAQVLVEIKRTEAWKTWDHASFDDFVTRDLHMKISEAHQLISSYGFLEKHEKKILDKPIEQVKVPDAKVINLLDKAAERGQLTDSEYNAIRDRVWDPELSTAELTKDITGRYPAPPPAEPSPAQKLRRLVLAAVVGAKPLPRTEVVKKLWAYIKKNDLQDKKSKRVINADDKLKAVFGGKKSVDMFEMTKLVSKHLKG